ncbi:hypothetical protein QQS21_000605 [Conoideocrella luteorostrata]|uniref:Uncharacterized protein n=1 Tax=Conoideocrella luteorostrata TaxID=1105319 RepID=A0AAJ0CYU6_9HYPO|nr:hypothetical protein QQS21_000605 [Conoideocrella luteorostrata]
MRTGSDVDTTGREAFHVGQEVNAGFESFRHFERKAQEARQGHKKLTEELNTLNEQPVWPTTNRIAELDNRGPVRRGDDSDDGTDGALASVAGPGGSGSANLVYGDVRPLN